MHADPVPFHRMEKVSISDIGAPYCIDNLERVFEWVMFCVEDPSSAFYMDSVESKESQNSPSMVSMLALVLRFIAAALFTATSEAAEPPAVRPAEIQVSWMSGQLQKILDVAGNLKPVNFDRFDRASDTYGLDAGPDTKFVTNYDAIAKFVMPGAGALWVEGSVKVCLSPASNTSLSLEAVQPGYVHKGNLFYNILSTEIARHQQAVFRLKSSRAIISTKGGRFYVHDDNAVQSTNPGRIPFNIIGVFDGAVTVYEPVSKQQLELKDGSAVVVREGVISKARPLTRAEVSRDLVCKLAASGSPPPSEIPATMRKTTKPPSGSQINSLGMLLVPVPGTKVLMCAHETRLRDFNGFGKMRRYNHMSWGWLDYPENVTWDNAKAFCKWLSAKEGKAYRLPTDFEWSCAVGVAGKEKRKPETTPEELAGGVKNAFPWGTGWPPPENAGNYRDLSYKMDDPLNWRPTVIDHDDGFIDTAPVMSFAPNKLGIYDLGGNVSEWCEDWYNAEKIARVVRGGAAVHGGFVPRTDNRDGLLSSWRGHGVPSALNGFRIVLELP